MAVNTKTALWLVVLLLLGCDELSGLEGETLKPLAHVRLQSSGELAAVLASGRDAKDVRLRVALVWGASSVPKRFCLEHGSGLPLGLPASASITAVAEAGCEDPLGFAPQLASSGASLAEEGTITIDLNYLPSAEVLVGPPEGRVGYASVVIYDDRNGNGALDLQWTRRNFAPGEDFGETPGGQDQQGGPGGHGGPDGQDTPDEDKPAVDEDDPLGLETPDEVYGASFDSILKPNVRVAFREGDFGAALKLFYPMPGCEAPAKGFSIISVSGPFLKPTCVASPLETTVLDIPLQATSTLAHLACRPSRERYYNTERKAELSLPWACLSDNELVVANPPGPCKSITTFLLKGCRESTACKEPDWDMSDKPPDWWPCHGIEAAAP